MTYDSTEDTLTHIDRVRSLLRDMADDLDRRAKRHDRTKLMPPEKPIFDEFTPKLKEATYGSDEYKGFLAEMKVALDHHYAHNSHHPEHYSAGIRGMDLLDVVEMICDWKAATERHANGNLARSIVQNQERFGYSEDLKAILVNTAARMGWISEDDMNDVANR